MISQNPYSNCLSARLYYYDFLSEENTDRIPESTLDHIMHCPDCQLEIGRLEKLLGKVDEGIEDQQSRRTSAITTLLKFHFAHVGEPVTCNTLKPFLASLADPVLQIRIPTPITRHLEECRNCRTDLQILQNLNLTHKQLCRLGQLLAEEPTNHTVGCSQARQAIPAVASMVLRDTDAETLKHLTTCPGCREKLIQRREELRRTLADSRTDQGKIPCKAVLPSDIFDYAFPYGIDPADDEYAEFREPLASHLAECPACLAKVQQLQKTIYSIVERPESGVVTVYHIEEPVPAGTENDAGHMPPKTTINLTARLKQGLLSPKVKPWLKAAAAAAAVVLIGLTLMLYESTVTAVSYDRMKEAIDEAVNIHTTTFDMGKTEPRQQDWVSRSLSIHMYQIGNKVVQWDFANKFRKEKQLDSDPVNVKELPENTLDAIERNVAVFLDIIPYRRLSEAPKGSNWDPVKDEELAVADKGSEVYDFTWIDRSYRGSLIFCKRRYFIDPHTNIPSRVQFYRRSSKNEEYALESKMFIELLEDSDMQAVIENAFP